MSFPRKIHATIIIINYLSIFKYVKKSFFTLKHDLFIVSKNVKM